MINGRPCTEYELDLERESGAFLEGAVWLDDPTGTPREISTIPDPLPKHVRRMATVSRCGAPDSLGWRVMRTTIEGEGGFLFIKKRIRSVIEFGNHWILVATLRARSGGLPPSGPPR